MNSLQTRMFHYPLLARQSINGRVPLFGGNQDGDYSAVFKPVASATHASNTTAYDDYEGRPSADPFVLDAIRKYVPPGLPVVELGCHAANNLAALDDTRNPLIGIDLSGAAVNRANTKLAKQGKKHTQVVQWDFAENGTLPPQFEHLKGKIGAICAVQVFPHLTDDCLIQTIQKLKDYLAPNGVIIFTNIEEDWPGWQYHSLEEQLQNGEVTHSNQTIRKAFQGMEQIDGRVFQDGEPAFSWFTRFPSLRGKMHWSVFRKKQ